jgi:hypothetical protein
VNAPLSDEQQLYYLQDSRQFVGNCMLWWRKGGAGYCCDLAEAGLFTKEEAYRQHAMRETDVPWPKAYIDTRAALYVDHQRADRELMLAAYDPERLDEMRKPKKVRKHG